MNQAASFPSTKFVVSRHRTERWVHSILREGRYLKPDTKLPAFSRAYGKTWGYPEDGDIFTMPYDELLARIKESSR